MQDILYGKWGFGGYFTSDCWAIKDFHEKHRVTADSVESVALAVNNGCHLNCGNLYGYCLIAVKEGLLSEEKIDDAVEHLFITRMKLGILGGFQTKPEYTNIPYDVVDCRKHRDLNLKVSQNGIVLLKNDGILPLEPGKFKSVAVIGPNANSRGSLEGNYVGTASEYVTVLYGMHEKARQHGFRVHYAEGCHLFKTKTDVLSMPDNRESEAVAVAKRADVIVVCLGLDSTIEGEQGDVGNEYSSGDKENLQLPPKQQRLLEKVTRAASGKPVILVNLAGSALAVTWADANVNAILHAFYPGAQGGRAVADILFGEVSPSGKLPVTFYKNDSDLPDFCDYSMENRTYRYFRGEPLYPFGFGLGFSKFEINGVSVTQTEAVCTVRNVGAMKSGEVVQVYAGNANLREIRSLIGFKRVELDAGETQNIVIKLDKNAFSRRDEKGDLYKAAGKYEISVGFSQPDARSAALYGGKPVIAELDV
jgi:beta-glucosidase